MCEEDAEPTAPGKRTSVTIAKKLEIIEFYKSLPDTVSAKEWVTRLKYPESLTTSGMLGRWTKASKKFGWRYLPQEIAQKCKEAPGKYSIYAMSYVGMYTYAG